ncbi:NAD(P)H-dependent flavin oxidoreductase [Clostridium sp.]|uniref:NAD(P)H-dependent flavin oxidoreductase n=1 Tax=Clostridium sp. TaxID=1506 RepID=UPI003F3FBCB9
MNIKPLVIGDLIAKLPIIQGGMGIGVSLSNLAGAVAKAGGIGVISGAQTGFKEPDFNTNTLEANLRAIKKHIKIAKEKSNNGIIGINLMVAMNKYKEHVEAAIQGGVDLIISGAGLPTKLPKYTKGSNVKIAPIVSSVKATKVILGVWDRHNSVTADAVIIEGPKAGGHLGFAKESLNEEIENFDTNIKEIIEVVKTFEEKYNKSIPVIVAGGVFNGYDIAKYLKLGASGVQMGTRFVGTHECDADDKFKEAYVNCSNDDISIVKSPVGMPGRAIANKFVDSTKEGNLKVSKCYDCLIPCNPASTPYCISEALMNAVKGNLDNGLIFCGSNACKVNKLVSVQDLMDELSNELNLA